MRNTAETERCPKLENKKMDDAPHTLLQNKVGENLSIQHKRKYVGKNLREFNGTRRDIYG